MISAPRKRSLLMYNPQQCFVEVSWDYFWLWSIISTGTKHPLVYWINCSNILSQYYETLTTYNREPLIQETYSLLLNKWNYCSVGISWNSTWLSSMISACTKYSHLSRKIGKNVLWRYFETLITQFMFARCSKHSRFSWIIESINLPKYHETPAYLNFDRHINKRTFGLMNVSNNCSAKVPRNFRYRYSLNAKWMKQRFV